MREPNFAGSFYPGTEHSLREVLKQCFEADLGPGALPSTPRKQALPVKGVITPHASFNYSGMAAAWSYKALAEAEMPDLYILLGPNHRTNQSGLAMETVKTPLGIVRTDQEFGKALAARGNIMINEAIHSSEHSLEVQLPFLQFSMGRRAENIKILPVMVSDDLDLDKAARDIKETLSEQKKKACFIVSSDFTHYGEGYGFVPFRDDVKEKIKELDMGAVGLIKKQDADGFRDYVMKTGATICGYLAIMLFLKTASFDKPALEQYYSSADITGDYSRSVSYASMVFR